MTMTKRKGCPECASLRERLTRATDDAERSAGQRAGLSHDLAAARARIAELEAAACAAPTPGWVSGTPPAFGAMAACIEALATLDDAGRAQVYRALAALVKGVTP